MTNDQIVNRKLDIIMKHLDVMATKDDLKKLEVRLTSVEGRMATKEDLIRMEKNIRGDMATKDDLKKIEERMATKEELQKQSEQIRKQGEQLQKHSIELFRISATEDKILSKLLDHDKQFKNMATKEDLKELNNDVINHVDGFIKLYKITDHEVTAVKSGLNRLEDNFKTLKAQCL